MQTLCAVSRTLGRPARPQPAVIGDSYIPGIFLPSPDLLVRLAPLRPVHGYSTIVAHQAIDIFSLWGAWEECLECQCEVPFWAVVWPGAAVLARYLGDNREHLLGKTVLDLGCGGGVAGIAASLCGAKRVIANDIDPVALHISSLNAAANNATVEFSGENLIGTATAADPEIIPDIILVGDMFYQREVALKMLDLLNRMRIQHGTEILIADGNRPFAPKTGIEVLRQEHVPVNMELEGLKEREVRLLRLTGNS